MTASDDAELVVGVGELGPAGLGQLQPGVGQSRQWALLQFLLGVPRVCCRVKTSPIVRHPRLAAARWYELSDWLPPNMGTTFSNA